MPPLLQTSLRPALATVLAVFAAVTATVASSAKSEPVVHPLSSVDSPPTLQKQAPAHYPEHMLNIKIEGEVSVAFVIDEKGRTRDVEVVKSTQREFEADARDAAIGTSFTPAQKGGEPVATRAMITYTFSLAAKKGVPSELKSAPPPRTRKKPQ